MNFSSIFLPYATNVENGESWRTDGLREPLPFTKQCLTDQINCPVCSQAFPDGSGCDSGIGAPTGSDNQLIITGSVRKRGLPGRHCVAAGQAWHGPVDSGATMSASAERFMRGRPIAMHLSLKGLLRTPEAHHEAYQSMISAVPQTAENNLSGPPRIFHTSIALKHDDQIFLNTCTSL
ncbi:hypothetical protein J6590_004647 [Homalodisca vitripennis]|nr:hypothetical protein J6590_004647 [Homalodisca vitripennis]